MVKSAAKEETPETAEEEEDDCTFEKILVTVGTTEYNSLVDLFFTPRTITQLHAWRTQSVRIQYGATASAEHVNRWSSKVKNSKVCGIEYNLFPIKPSIADDIAWADLIIGHAGSGTTLDVLEAKKPFVAIPNEELMDNHQMELARFLQRGAYAFVTTLNEFSAMAGGIKKSELAEFPKRDLQATEEYFIRIMNFNVKQLQDYYKQL